jgi:ubiquinol-cytochrome c reductase iron-sulfur subunit
MAEEKNVNINLDADTPLENPERRDFMVMTASGIACVGAAAAAIPFVTSLAPSAEVLAVGSTEVDLTKIKEGHTITVMWRGYPVFIRNRTQKEIDEARSVNMADLRDPETDEKRVQKGYEKWLIVIGSCTHLGCIPIANKGDYDGWLCPCHGSHYDTSARIRKGPAPKNLEVPTYAFVSETKLKIG